MELQPIFYTLDTVDVVVVLSGICTILAICFSTYLIRQHLAVFTKPYIQSKILGIIYMVPIYSIDSFIGLLWPYQAVYINMARDCYEAYVLYLFLSLMLSYLECEIDDTEVVAYLETKPRQSLPFPFHYCFPGEIPRGREFLRYCKFGTLQYCVIRPTTAITAMILDLAGVYHDGDLSFRYGYIYILIIINFSVAYAFIVLATFYSLLKEKLKPFEPIGKFLCIKFVIFFAFWQSVMITGMVKLGWIQKLGEYGPDVVATGLQNFLICIEMTFVAFAHLFTFSYQPFDPTSSNRGVYEKLVTANDDEEAIYFSTDPARRTQVQTKEKYRQYLRKSNKLSAVVLPKLQEKEGQLSPPPARSANYQPLEKLETRLPAERSLEEEERYERELLFDTQVWAKANLKMKARLLGDHLRLGAQETLHQAVEKTKKSLKSASTVVYTGGASSVASGGSIGSRTPYPPRPAAEANSSLLDRHFAASAAIRDFNETMPVVVLPSKFEAKKGLVIRSDPASRVEEYEEMEARKQEILRQQQRQQRMKEEREQRKASQRATTAAAAEKKKRLAIEAAGPPETSSQETKNTLLPSSSSTAMSQFTIGEAEEEDLV